jgi:hypothetical protein
MNIQGLFKYLIDENYVKFSTLNNHLLCMYALTPENFPFQPFFYHFLFLFQNENSRQKKEKKNFQRLENKIFTASFRTSFFLQLFKEEKVKLNT